MPSRSPRFRTNVLLIFVLSIFCSVSRFRIGRPPASNLPERNTCCSRLRAPRNPPRDSPAATTPSHKVALHPSNFPTQLYDWELLRPGNRVEGCAVLEGANSTYFVPEGWTLVVDQFGNAKLNRK